MELSKAIIAGSATAAKLVLDYLSLPRLTCLTPPWTIPLETEELQQHGEAKVAESVLIAALPGEASKAFIADNVAPGPYTWRLSGYIPGKPIAEPTNLYTPFVRMNVANIRAAFKAGSLLSFKDGDNIIYKNVVIQSLDIDTRADTKNRVPFSMVLKEINILDSIGGAVVQDAAQVAAGSLNGEQVKVGNVATQQAKNYSIIAPTANYGVAALASTPTDD